MLQGYEDDPEPDDEDEEDASYADADDEYGVATSNHTKKKAPKKKKIPSVPSKPRPAVRHSPSDSDSDYGARSKKKKKQRVASDEIRVSSRGTKVPNYVDDVQDFEAFDEDEVIPGGYVDSSATQKEEDEIEMVLGHSRDEDHKDDPEDNWYTNVVRPVSLYAHFR